MEAVLERKKWVAPTRKLTAEEVEALIENYDYDPNWDDGIDDDDYEIEPLYDKYGNPSESMIRSLYEDRHDLSEVVTLEELFAPYADTHTSGVQASHSEALGL